MVSYKALNTQYESIYLCFCYEKWKDYSSGR